MAGYPVAAGVPSHSGNLTPYHFAPEINIEFYNETFLPQISNTKYEGILKKSGDKVIIRTMAPAVIRDYVKGADLIYDKPETSTIEMEVDQGLYWAIWDWDVDKAQSDIDYIPEWTRHHGKLLKEEVNKRMLAYMFTNAHAKNSGSAAGVISGNLNLGKTGTPVELTKANIIDYLIHCKTALGEQNVPSDMRWIVISEAVASLINRSDLKDASLSGDGTSMLRNGKLGKVGDMDIYVSNQLATTSESGSNAYHMVFGHKVATAFAGTIEKIESFRREADFGDGHRGLYVFGRKVVKSEALGALYAVVTE